MLLGGSMKRLVIIFLIFTVFYSFLLSTENELGNLLDMTLDELLNIEIRTGTLTSISGWKNPVALTVITKEEIISTPARNLLDILETFIPGFTYVEHFMGPRMGMRGMLGDQNYSFLMLVNGKNVNLKYSFGPFFEMLNKDLNDIEKIEVIRGPGSVTYGPGAITGIINIITICSEEENYFKGKLAQDYLYRFDKYSFCSKFSNDVISTSLKFSYCKSEGEKDTKFWYIDRAHGFGYGFMNPDWGNQDLGSFAPNMLGDYHDEPQVKIQYSIELPYGLEFWTRYTTTNNTYTTQSDSLFGSNIWTGILGKHLLIELKQNHSFSDQLSWENKLGFDSANIREYRYGQGEDVELEHIAQRRLSFSENEFNLRTQVNYQPSDKLDIANGFEYGYEYYAPEWGDDDDSFLMSFQSPIKFAVKDTMSGFYQYYKNTDLVPVIDDDISGHFYSLFTEANFEANKYLTLLFSARLDKHKYAKHTFSPRLALISEIDDRNIVKVIAQRSVRLPVFSNLYSQNYLGKEFSEFEEMQGIELVYQRIHNPHTTFYLNTYLNSIDQFAWISDGDSDKIGLAGNYNLLGLEMEMKYRDKRNTVGASYSLIEQLDWDAEFDDFAYLTFLDQDSIPLFENAENRINNLPKHQLKTYWNCNITSNLHLFLDGRCYFDYQQGDMLDKFQNAISLSENEVYITEMNNIRKALEKHGYAKPSFTSNASISWISKFSDLDFTLRIFARNLLQYNHIRYVIQYWETGNLRQYPRQCGFIEEPFDIGCELSVEF